jgi:hypothetical protein
MPRNYWMQGLPPFHTADGTALTTAATLTDIAPTPAVVFPANFLGEFSGIRLEVQAAGHYTIGATASNVTFGLYSGTIGQAIGSAVALATTATVAQVVSSTNKFWRMEGNLQIRTIGTSGTGIAVCEFSGVTSGGLDFAATTAGSTFTIDTTVARYLTLGATLSSATSNSLTCRYFGVRSVN